MAATTKGLTGNQLKIFALICMTLDHAGMLIFDQYLIFRYIGRLAMPIFAFMIAEGCRHTKSRFRYLITIAVVAALCQGVYWIVDRSLMQCILVTFTLSILLIYALDNAARKRTFFSGCILAAAFVAVCYITVFLPGKAPGFHVDYGFFGVMLPAAIYIGRTKEEKLFAAGVCMVGIALNLGYVQWFSFLSLPILYLYGGKRGKARLKYLFYIYYPLHLAILYAIAYFVK